jgi:hypothetical protein
VKYCLSGLVRTACDSEDIQLYLAADQQNEFEFGAPRGAKQKQV